MNESRKHQVHFFSDFLPKRNFVGFCAKIVVLVGD